MNETVVYLPRPSTGRKDKQTPSLYFRVGRNQHRDVLDILGEGESGFSGLIFDAHYSQRHRELRSEAIRRGLDVILDPKSHAMALPGSHTESLSKLPWGSEHHHTSEDFKGDNGRMLANKAVDFALKNGFTEIHGLTHIIRDASDPWLGRDIETMGWMREALDSENSKIPLIYPLALPIQVLRDPEKRRLIIGALSRTSFDSLWLRVENFGMDASGEKTAAYIEACRDFHALDPRLVADFAGGLPGLALLAFSAVDGLAHGITMLQGFKASHWRHPPRKSGGGSPPTRIYVPGLDLFLKRAEADALLDSSPRVRGRFGCRDTKCCPGGIRDMLGHPARHFIHQRSSEVQQLAEAPPTLRVQTYLDKFVRTASDNVASASGMESIDPVVRERLRKKQAAISRYRTALTNLAEAVSIQSQAEPPTSKRVKE